MVTIENPSVLIGSTKMIGTTKIYAFNWLIPVYLTDVPIPFSQFAKYDENSNPIGYYSYNEWMSLDGHKPFYTPSGTHAILGIGTTSIKALATQFPAYLSAVSADTVWVEGVDVDKWQDADQTHYLWTLTTDPTVPYNYDAFTKVSPLFKEPA